MVYHHASPCSSVGHFSSLHILARDWVLWHRIGLICMSLSRVALKVPQRKGEFSAWKTFYKQQVVRLNNLSKKIKFNKLRMPNEVCCLPFITFVESFFPPFLPSFSSLSCISNRWLRECIFIMWVVPTYH